MKKIYFAFASLALLGVIRVTATLLNRQHSPSAHPVATPLTQEPTPADSARQFTDSTPQIDQPLTSNAPSRAASSTPPARSGNPNKPTTPAPIQSSNATPDSPEDPLIPEPIARQALGLVGADPVAEAVWVTAINDLNLTPDERQNLIEDLNEDGFPNPKRLTPDDLPLIESRIALIEELAPDAIDDTNTAAFKEAYKDLINMRDQIAQK